MTIKAISWVLEHSQSKGNTRCVLIAIADRVNDYGECWPPLEYIQRDANVSESTARRSIQELETLGELEVIERAGDQAAMRA